MNRGFGNTLEDGQQLTNLSNSVGTIGTYFVNGLSYSSSLRCLHTHTRMVSRSCGRPFVRCLSVSQDASSVRRQTPAQQASSILPACQFPHQGSSRARLLDSVEALIYPP